MHIVIFFLSLVLQTLLAYEQYESYYDVVVIGAGAAGLAAATRLLENKFDNIAILEAESRLGGRIKSVKIGNVYVDFGAEFCEGEHGNAVYDLAKEFNILKPTEVKTDFIYSNGTVIDDPELTFDFLGFPDSLQYKEKTEDETDLSYGEYFMKYYDEEVLEKHRYNNDKLKICVDAISTLESKFLIREGSFSWLKSALVKQYETCSGNQFLNWNGAGYKKILSIMMKSYPEPYNILSIEDKIWFRKSVINIQYGGYDDNKVIVTCEDGIRYAANFVIFTPSLGVLKHRHQTLFTPELPVNHRECIVSLGFDATMKFVLEFEEKWWPGDFTGKALVWSAEDKINLAQTFPQGPVKNGESWLSHIKFIMPAVESQNVLMLYMTGNFIEDIERATNDTKLEGVMFVLKRFFGDATRMTYPINLYSTDWYTNPNFYGTASFETLGSKSFPFKCHEELAKPLQNSNHKPVVLFAGEATSPDHYSTVHGAIETGYREANRILQYYDSNRIPYRK